MIDEMEVMKWVGGIISGITLLYIGLQWRNNHADRKAHLARTMSLELAHGRLATIVTSKLDDLIKTNELTRDSLIRLKKSLTEVTTSVARIEGSMGINVPGGKT